MTDTTSIQNPTSWSDYDFLEFECFVSKVYHEGFAYAVENYGPEFEAADLKTVADDMGALRSLYLEYEPKVEAWYDTVGMERACDLHNAHVDESRKRSEDACLFGIRCVDGFVLTCDTEAGRDRHAAYLMENKNKGWRVPSVLLVREVPGGEWTEVRPA